MLKIHNLKINRDGKEIVKGVDLEVKPGEVHAIMGPNGGGKSTLTLGIMGTDSVNVSDDSSIMIDEQEISKLKVDERSRAGLFLAFQNPVEVSGVSYIEFLRLSYNSTMKVRFSSEFNELSPHAFRKLVKFELPKLQLNESFLERNLNEGFSGGEKKKSELLQALLLKPKYIILDEIDSGLDVTALHLAASVINELVRDQKTGVLIITHYNRILQYLDPKYVHILKDGRIAKTGPKDLALEIEKIGYE